MKLLVFIFILLIYPFRESENIFPLNEEGKISFRETVSLEGAAESMLFKNALNYMGRVKHTREHGAKVQANMRQGLVSKPGSFYVYKKGMFTPQLHGEIRYNLSIEVSDEGYTYNFTDFVFHYYAKNRFGVYAPVNGKKKPLETEKFAGLQDLWEEHKMTTLHHIQNHVKALRSSMSLVPPGAGLYDQEYYRELN